MWGVEGEQVIVRQRLADHGEEPTLHSDAEGLHRRVWFTFFKDHSQQWSYSCLSPQFHIF